MDNELPKRKNIRLKNFDYSSAGAYFLTICTKDRLCVLSLQGVTRLFPVLFQHSNVSAIKNTERTYGKTDLTTILYAIVKILMSI